MMYLQTDEQTIGDLGIFGSKTENGIYDIYNNAHTRGGEQLLEVMFRSPLSDRAAINNRSAIISQMMAAHLRFPFDVSLFDIIEKYLAKTGHQSYGQRGEIQLNQREIQQGVAAVISLLHQTKDFLYKKKLEILSNTKMTAGQSCI